MSQVVTLIPGDWVGPEVTATVQRLIAAAGADLDWDVQEAGERTWKERRQALPREVLDAIVRNKVCLKGRLAAPPDVDVPAPTVQLRKELDLYFNMRPIRNQWRLPARYPDIDLIVVRESTEDVYASREHVVIPGVIEALKVVTRPKCERIARAAFELARAMGRKKVTTVHKANIMKVADGLFLRTATEIATEYPDIEHANIIVDNLAMQLVSRPAQFDVLLTGNLFGDIISDLATGLVGGISQVPSINRGPGDLAVFEALHAQAPEIAGKDLANPLPLLTPALWLLRELGHDAAAERIETATHATLAAGIRTQDLGGTATLSQLERGILSRMR